MLPSKKRKGITLPPGKSIEIGFATKWRRDKEEVIITTDDGEILLDGRQELFLKISASNTDPVKVKIVPDFKKRVLNFIEVIDVNAKQTTCENKAKLSFVDVSTPKDETFPIGQYLKMFDEDIEKFGKQIKACKKPTTILVALNIALILFNLYIFTTGNWSKRYLNLISIMILGSLTYYLWYKYRKLCKVYEEYKDLRFQAFEVVKRE